MVIHIAFIILSLIQTLHVPSTLNEHCCLNLIFHKLIDVLASSSLILECVLPLREDSVDLAKPLVNLVITFGFHGSIFWLSIKHGT